MKKQDKSENKTGVVILKLGLYLISLWILLFMLTVLKADLSDVSVHGMSWTAWKMVLLKNIVPCVCVILIILGGISYLAFRDMLNNAKSLPVKIEQYYPDGMFSYGNRHRNLCFVCSYHNYWMYFCENEFVLYESFSGTVGI